MSHKSIINSIVKDMILDLDDPEDYHLTQVQLQKKYGFLNLETKMYKIATIFMKRITSKITNYKRICPTQIVTSDQKILEVLPGGLIFKIDNIEYPMSMLNV